MRALGFWRVGILSFLWKKLSEGNFIFIWVWQPCTWKLHLFTQLSEHILTTSCTNIISTGNQMMVVLSKAFKLPLVLTFAATRNFYRPQHSCRKVMFSQACVKNSVRGSWRGRGRAWQERPQLQRTVRILLECILVWESSNNNGPEMAGLKSRRTKGLSFQNRYCDHSQ